LDTTQSSNMNASLNSTASLFVLFGVFRGYESQQAETIRFASAP
jgi:hypothetical protein